MSMSAMQVIGDILMSKGYRVIIDQYTTPGKVYFGIARSGTTKAQNKWAILCLDQTEGGKISDFEWADGKGLDFHQIWNKRADGTYTYPND